MKKILVLFTALCFLTNTFAAFEIKHPTKNAAEIFLPVGNAGQKISLMDLSKISVKDFEKLSGKHLNFFDRIAFKSGQRNLRNGISVDGTIENKKLLKFTDGDGDHSTGFHFGGFALGFFLPLIGVGIAYLIGGEEDVRRNRVKWAWIGTGISATIFSALAKLLIG